MNLYPIFLKLDKLSCCVVGGGSIALRKVRSLIASKADIIVVSPVLCRQLELLKKKKYFRHVKDKYKKKILEGVGLVIAATDDQSVNKRISGDAIKLKLLVNVVDSPQECNFYVPSSIKRNGVVMAVSTQGAFPALAKKIQQDCMPVMQRYAGSIRKLVKLRKDIYSGNDTYKKKIAFAKDLLRTDIMKMVENKDICSIADLKAYLNKCSNL